MNKRILFVLVSLILASMVYAQSSGGEIKREIPQDRTQVKRRATKKVSPSSKPKSNSSSSRPKRNASSTDVSMKSYSAEEMYEIGNEYEDKGDIHSAIVWYKKSAELGYMDAQGDLGLIYLNGKGVSPNPVEAVKWLVKAANQGDVLSQLVLGQMYKEGLGVSKNQTESNKWYDMAAKSCYENGYDAMFFDGNRAVDLFKIAIEIGAMPYNVWAMYQLGAMYYNGDGGIGIDYPKSFMYFKMASDKGNVRAMYYLGMCYERGRGIPKDYEKANFYYKSSGLKSIPSREF